MHIIHSVNLTKFSLFSPHSLLHSLHYNKIELLLAPDFKISALHLVIHLPDSPFPYFV